MKINHKKSNIIKFNNSRKYDFPPEFSFQNGSNLDVHNEIKLLGVYLNSNLKWDSNTSAIYKKAMSRMWILRRMRNLKLDPTLVLDFYVKEIRPLAEHAVSVWNSGLTKYQVKLLEKIQKVALTIILGNDYKSYEHACSLFNLDTLSHRREQLCIKFAIKLYHSSRCEQFFTKAKNTVSTRSKPKLVHENITRTKRSFLAPHNYLARLVNENSQNM